MNQTPKIAFFGGEPLGLVALEKLIGSGLAPELVICNPDRPSGRGQQLHEPRVKALAAAHDIPVFQPSSYKQKESLMPLTEGSWDLFVVVAYNYILPKWLIELPTHGTLNVHPSLLPKLRGASPIRTAILENRPEEIGVSVMLLSEKMDEGPILRQAAVALSTWPIPGPELDTLLAEKGADLLAETIPDWLEGMLTPLEQDHAAATYSRKFHKTDAELSLDPTDLPTGTEALSLLLKIDAFAGVADCFFIDKGKRIKIKAAALSGGGQLQLLRVIPEGKKEMDFSAYLSSR